MKNLKDVDDNPQNWPFGSWAVVSSILPMDHMYDPSGPKGLINLIKKSTGSNT